MTPLSVQPINVIRSILKDSVGNDLLELILLSNHELLFLLILVLHSQLLVIIIIIIIIFGGKLQVSLRSWPRIIADLNMF